MELKNQVVFECVPLVEDYAQLIQEFLEQLSAGISIREKRGLARRGSRESNPWKAGAIGTQAIADAGTVLSLMPEAPLEAVHEPSP